MFSKLADLLSFLSVPSLVHLFMRVVPPGLSLLGLVPWPLGSLLWAYPAYLVLAFWTFFSFLSRTLKGPSYGIWSSGSMWSFRMKMYFDVFTICRYVCRAFIMVCWVAFQPGDTVPQQWQEFFDRGWTAVRKDVPWNGLHSLQHFFNVVPNSSFACVCGVYILASLFCWCCIKTLRIPPLVPKNTTTANSSSVSQCPDVKWSTPTSNARTLDTSRILCTLSFDCICFYANK